MQLKFGLKKATLFLWTFVFLCLRPSVFGERYNLIVFIWLLGISVFALILFRKDLLKVQIESFGLLALVFILVLYLFIQGMILSSNAKTVFNSNFLVFSISVLSLYILSLDKIFLIKSIVYIHLVFSLSSITTIVLFILSGFNNELLTITSASNFIENYISSEDISGYQYDLMFPFSLSWSTTQLMGINIPRLLGIYREPGMAQIFFFTAYFLTYVIDLKKVKFVRITLLVGGFLTFSTAGLLSFVAGYLVMRFYPQHKIRLNITKLVLVFVGIPVIIIAALYTPNFGLLAKINSISGQERTKSYQRSWDELMERPLFGQGYYNIKYDSEKNVENKHVDTLGLIGIAYQIGVVGIILYLSVWFYSFYYFNDHRTYFVVIPCLLTLLLSQPSFNDMIVWFLLSVNFKSIANTRMIEKSQS